MRDDKKYRLILRLLRLYEVESEVLPEYPFTG